MPIGLSQGQYIGVGQEQRLGTTQTLAQTMAPVQLQSLNILQKDSLELEQHVKETLEQNPVLIEVRPANTVSIDDLEAPTDGTTKTFCQSHTGSCKFIPIPSN